MSLEASGSHRGSLGHLRTIALEEHCLTPELHGLAGERSGGHAPAWPPALEARLLELGAGRVAEMDAAGIDMQVLSAVQCGLESAPAARAVGAARAFNDRVAAAVVACPERLAAFAALPMAAPAEAAAELERSVNELGCVGALISGRVEGRFLDAVRFWPVFECAEALGVPIYLHPAPPPAAVSDAYYTGFAAAVDAALATTAWGWHIETGLHVLRLIAAGVFDRFPALQVIVGHMGEALPFMLARVEEVLRGRLAADAGFELPVPAYFARNVHVTTSGMFTDPPLRCALDVLGSERTMFAVDHPFSDGATGRRWLLDAPLDDGERNAIAHGNAERLLRL